jgi:DNA-binding NtrC family response regulator
VIGIFRNYDWAGNVRELRNVVERCLILEDEDVITTAYLPQNLYLQALKGISTAQIPSI